MTSPAFVVAGAISANNRVLSFRSAMLGSNVSRKSVNILPYRRAILPKFTPTATAEETAQETTEQEQTQDSPSVPESTSVQEPVVNEDSTKSPIDSIEQPVAQVESTADNSEETATEQPTAEDENAAPKGGEKRRRRRPGNKREVTLPLDNMTVGMELEGVVKSVTNYGAFVGEMGTPTDGLLHVSQLTNGFVENVTDIVNIGDKVNVRVLSIDMDKGNFSLTMKTAEEVAASDNKGKRREGGQDSRRDDQKKKWAEFKFDAEVFVDAKVVSVTDFGAFCQLLKEDGEPNEMSPTDGLVHISEISEDHVQSVRDNLSIGQMVKVRVISTDRKRKRISLSMKSASSGSGADANVAKDIAIAEEKQPTFKTSFELAFERAKAETM